MFITYLHDVVMQATAALFSIKTSNEKTYKTDKETILKKLQLLESVANFDFVNLIVPKRMWIRNINCN
jgi:hypothetical protein